MPAPSLNDIVNPPDDDNAILLGDGSDADTDPGDGFDDHVADMQATHAAIKGEDVAMTREQSIAEAARKDAISNPLLAGQTINGIQYPGQQTATAPKPNTPASVSGRTSYLEGSLDALQAKSNSAPLSQSLDALQAKASNRPDLRFANLTPPPRPGIQVQPSIPPSPIPPMPTTPFSFSLRPAVNRSAIRDQFPDYTSL